MLPIRYSFGLNTDIFETNIVNLSVVVAIVVTVVGDAFQTLLEQRRKTILSTLQEANQKAIDAQKRLEEARKAVEIALLRAQEIRIQAIQAAERENLNRKRQLREDLQRLQEVGDQAIQLERQRALRSITREIIELARTSAEGILLMAFRPRGPVYSKQRHLNDVHMRETFSQLKI